MVRGSQGLQRGILCALLIAVLSCSRPVTVLDPTPLPSGSPPAYADSAAVRYQCLRLVGRYLPGAELRAAYASTARAVRASIEARVGAELPPYFAGLYALAPNTPVAACYLYGPAGFALPVPPNAQIMNLALFFITPDEILLGGAGYDGVMPIERPHA